MFLEVLLPVFLLPFSFLLVYKVSMWRLGGLTKQWQKEHPNDEH